MAASHHPAITALTTGTVRIKAAMKRGRGGPDMARRGGMFLPGEWTGPLPINAWLIEHDDGPILVDTGEYAEVNDTPFARFEVEPADEIHQRLATHGVEPGDLRTVVLTHVHVDHADGLARLPGAPAIVSDVELRVVRSLGARILRKVLRQPLPPGFDVVRPVSLEDGPPVGAFPSSYEIASQVHLVPAPGHTPGHAAVLVERGDHHVLLSGDASYDEAQLLDRHVDGVSPKAGVARATMDTILEHARGHPTVILPSHDPGGARRLAAVEVTRPG